MSGHQESPSDQAWRLFLREIVQAFRKCPWNFPPAAYETALHAGEPLHARELGISVTICSGYGYFLESQLSSFGTDLIARTEPAAPPSP